MRGERRTWGWLAILWWLAAPVMAQRADADWRLRETAFFRIYYPAPADAWVARLAPQLDALRARVEAEVGHAPTAIVDVVVADPVGRANGIAYPLLGTPRMVLWTTPPGPDSSLGHFRDWGTLLAIHETGHMVHLLRPSRNRAVHLSRLLIPAGPLTRKAPRWLIEGYATWLEGELTGAGRPNSDLRAAILRRWAQHGSLPTYPRLSSDAGRWMGMSMAYLVGSAYLEWLVARTGPDSLRHLWARMSARVNRPFTDAFVGVFGDTPQRLYDRFRAEQTFDALRQEAEREALVASDDAWLATTWGTGAPALSPDGQRLAFVRRTRDRPSTLEVYTTADDPDAATRREKANARLLAQDPLDVPAVPVGPPSRRPSHVLPTRDGAEPSGPRWLGPDALLYVRFEPGYDGVVRPDLFRWTLSTDKVERLTRGAGVRDPDPAPDGTWAVAVRSRWGAAELVRIRLRGPNRGSVVPLIEGWRPRVDTVYAQPRVSPTGDRVAYAVHRDGSWQLEIVDLASERVATMPTAADTIVAQPAWSADGRQLLASIGVGGYIEIHAFDGATGRTWPVVRTHGAAVAPAPTPDGTGVFYLALEPAGLVLSRHETTAGAWTEASEWNPGAATESGTSHQPLGQERASGRRTDEPTSVLYGFGRPEWLPLVAGAWAPGAGFVEAGVRVGDLIGRFDVVALGTTGATAEGAAAGVVLRRWPVTLAARGSRLRHIPSRQGRVVEGLGEALDLERSGLELAARWQRGGRTARLELVVGGFSGAVEDAAGRSDQTIGFVRGQYNRQWRRGRWRLASALAAGLDDGRTAGDRWQRWGGAAQLQVIRSGLGLGWSWRQRQASGTVFGGDRLQVGGVAPSLLPESQRLAWLEVPGLPTGTLLGDRYEGQRVDVLLGSPVRLFASRHRLRDSGARDWLRLVGVEWSGSRAAWPLVRLPAMDWTLGVAQTLDPPFEDNLGGWIRLRWRP